MAGPPAKMGMRHTILALSLAIPPASVRVLGGSETPPRTRTRRGGGEGGSPGIWPGFCNFWAVFGPFDPFGGQIRNPRKKLHIPVQKLNVERPPVVAVVVLVVVVEKVVVIVVVLV